MPADRFFCEGPLIKGALVLLQGPEHHHLSRVMRIAVGEEVELVNGQGSLAKAEVSSIDKNSTTLNIKTVHTIKPPQRQIILAVAMMRPNKLEWVIEKGTELGAENFLLYAADYSEKSDLTANQLERLRTLMISALKQSGRLFLPGLEILSSIEDIHTPLLFGDTRPDAPSIFDLELSGKITFLTGPERGFSERELRILQKKGKGVRLSPYILRAETAPIAAISIIYHGK